MNRKARYIAYAVMFALFVVLCVAGHLIDPGGSSPMHFAGISVLGGILLIAAILILALETTLSSGRKELAIRLISDFVSNSQRVQDREVMRSSLPWPHVIQPGSPNFDDASNSLLLAVRRELDFLDAVACAVLFGAADEAIIRPAFERVVVEDATQFAPFIDHWQVGDHPVWAHMVELARRWA